MKLNFGRTMHLLALRYGDKPAIVNVERQRRYSYAQFHLLTNRIANVLRTELKVGKGDKFMLILDNDSLSLLHFPTFFKQEGTAVMTNLRDSLEEQRWQMNLAKPKVVFMETRLLDSHGPMYLEAGCAVVVMDPPSAQQRVEHPRALSFWDLVAAAPDAESDIVLDQREHLALLRFTGGTTGRGKCAMYCIDNWYACRDSVYMHPALGFDGEARMLHVAPLSHGSQIFYYPTFFAGGVNVTVNSPDLDAFRQIVETEAITHSFLVPTALYRLLELQRARPRKLDSLRTLVYGAAPMSPARLNDLVACFGPIFAQMYAATETPLAIAVLDKTEHRTDSEIAIRRMASAGRVTPGIDVFITDGEGKPLAVGETGEIRIRARGVIAGYFGNPEGTAAEFIDDAWRSGDLGYVDQDGFLYIVDRLKDMIISGGFNIYAVEVEAALGTHAAVMNSAVVGIPHPEWGEIVHAEVQLREGHKATAAELIEHVKGRIGSYKAPKSVAFADQLPLSAVGKVLRRQVRDGYWQGRERQVG
jgi:acyl-CoA synthetase (AMP-forming)/AMP-acid ligase II